MKKLVILAVSLLCITVSFAGNKEYSKWSLSGLVGLNKFDGDVNQTYKDVLPTSLSNISFGGELQYNLAPAWGLSIDYNYIPVKADVGDYLSIRTKANNINLNGVINFSELIFPNRFNRILFIGSVGIGLSRYDFNTTGIFPSPQATIYSKVENTYGLASTIPVSFALEYNTYSRINFGIKVNYIAFNKDNLEGLYYVNEVGGRTVYKGVSNDYVGLASLYIKYKFSVRKYKYTPDKKFQEELISSKGNRVKDNGCCGNTYITNTYINSNNVYNNTCDTCKREGLNEGINEGIKSGRCRYRDLDNTDRIPSIYFEFDKYDLDAEALKIISMVENELKSNPRLLVEIRAYCDNIGGVPYNEVLSIHRARVTMHELIRRGISPDRIVANGLGKLTDPVVRFRPNRRCDFFFFQEKYLSK